jgi:sulfite reductase (ferredoxin)
MSEPTWKDHLNGKIRADWGEEIDVFDRQMQLRKQGKMEEKLFAETRLRRGAYGQRYDNGQRHDGVDTRKLPFPSGELTKGAETMWDAPGMQRIKIPFGALTAEQMEVFAACSEEYSDAISHITTRQDIQLHFVHIEDVPDLMRRLAAVGITTREACGNSIRNITGCPLAGVCSDEGFDISPYAQAMMMFLLGHPDVQDFGRKFKPAFSGCEQHACGLTNIHDSGYIAKVQDGKRGFKLVVGGGLGAVPQDAKVLYEFCPEEEILPVTQAISRVFGRLGEKANRARARIKFLVTKLGIDEFRRLVEEERAKLRPDPRWTEYLQAAHAFKEEPLRPAAPKPTNVSDAAFGEWLKTNVSEQAQKGYFVATVKLRLGDITADQMRGLADIVRKYTKDTIRATVEQNYVLRWISGADLQAVHTELVALGIGEAGANTIADITSCPGTDTCKLGISASRGLGAEMSERLFQVREKLAPEVQGLRIKASGCFNSCGQHHIADIGFLGVARKVGRHRMPHFQLVIGGQWTNNGGSYGLAVGAVPSKRVPDVIERVTNAYVRDRQQDETFQSYIQRIGKAKVREMCKDLMEPLPSFDEAPDMYSDWGDPRLYTTGDMGVGECAGEIVPFVQFGLAAAERIYFDAQGKLDGGDLPAAQDLAYKAMLEAARALTYERFPNVGTDPQEVHDEFKRHLVDTQLFRDHYAGDKFYDYFKNAHNRRNDKLDAEQVSHQVQEATLFIEASHACVERMDKAKAAAVQAVAAPAAPAE